MHPGKMPGKIKNNLKEKQVEIFTLPLLKFVFILYKCTKAAHRTVYTSTSSVSLLALQPLRRRFAALVFACVRGH